MFNQAKIIERGREVSFFEWASIDERPNSCEFGEIDGFRPYLELVKTTIPKPIPMSSACFMEPVPAPRTFHDPSGAACQREP